MITLICIINFSQPFYVFCKNFPFHTLRIFFKCYISILALVRFACLCKCKILLCINSGQFIFKVLQCHNMAPHSLYDDEKDHPIELSNFSSSIILIDTLNKYHAKFLQNYMTILTSP